VFLSDVAMTTEFLLPVEPSGPVAEGLPISDRTASEAAEWLTVLMADKVSNNDHLRWQKWRAAHPDNERAWRHIEAMGLRLKALDHAAYAALSPFGAATSKRRRQALRAAAGLGLAGMAAWFVPRTNSWQVAMAEYRTAVGEQRTLRLEDGTELVLNTDSALDIRFDSRQRLVRLLDGEILISTGHLPSGGAERPFIVETRQGFVRALGTRFTVQTEARVSSVTVFEGAVRISPLDGRTDGQVLEAGQAGTFTEAAVEDSGAANMQAADWAQGILHADNMRLDELLSELGRYRHGVVFADPAVAALRVSGVFPLRDTDQALAFIPNSLPVEIRYRTRYWVTVVPRH
jgi:transmembrane sensor